MTIGAGRSPCHPERSEGSGRWGARDAESGIGGGQEFAVRRPRRGSIPPPDHVIASDASPTQIPRYARDDMRTIAQGARVLLILPVVASSALAASRISVDRPTVRLGETFRVTITLEGEAAEIDRLPIPLTNVEMLGSPNVSRQFSLVNGRFSRVKILDYAARPLAEGRAIVGPIRVALASRTLEIPGAAVEVLPAAAPGQETPSSVLRQMERESREAVFVTAQADRGRAVVGEQVIVTWTVWARDSMSEPSIIDLPRLEGFWAEEIPMHREITNVVVDGDLLARSVVRRVALFPMRSGEMEVGSLEVRAGTYQRRDPFGFLTPFRSGFANVNRSSPPLTIRVDPVPREADIVGSFAMSCTEPVSRGGGPVSFVVSIEGEGNLRLAPPPRFESEPAAEIQMEEGGLEVHRSAAGLRMTRSWTVLAIPGRSELSSFPPISLRAWNPVAGRMDVLRCEPGTVTVEPGRPSRSSAAPPSAGRDGDEVPLDSAVWPLLLAAALVILGGSAWFLLARRSGRLRPREERILRHADTPRRMKDEVKEMLREKAIDPALLYGAATPLAEAYRALWSLLDVLEKEPWEKERSVDDLRRRVRELVGRL